MAFEDLGATVRNIVNKTLRKKTQENTVPRVVNVYDPEYRPLTPARSKGEEVFYKSQSEPTKGDLQTEVQPVYGELPKEIREKHAIGYPKDPGQDYLDRHSQDLKIALEKEMEKARAEGREVVTSVNQHTKGSTSRRPPQRSREGSREPIR